MEGYPPTKKGIERYTFHKIENIMLITQENRRKMQLLLTLQKKRIEDLSLREREQDFTFTL